MSTANPSLNASSQTRRPRGWGRALSSRQVRNLIAVDQLWQDFDGETWFVLGIHRADQLARLQRCDFKGFAFVSFTELGKGYRPLGGRAER